MPGIKRSRKVGAVKRILNPKDSRVRTAPANTTKPTAAPKTPATFDGLAIRHVTKIPSALYFRYNTSLGPPYSVLIDTNFINFTIANKLDLFRALVDCLLAKVTPYITDCVMAELETLGVKYRVALRIAKDARISRLHCTHRGIYADDCLVDRVTAHKCYIVATCDRELKRRIRKIPGVPIMFISQHRYSIERFPDVNNAPRQG